MQRVFRTYPDYTPASVKIAVLAGQLDGSALAFYNSKDFYSSDWQTVCEHLQARFLPLATPHITWAEFWRVSQYNNDTGAERPIMDVIQQLESLQLRLGTSCPPEIMKNRLLGAFSSDMGMSMIQVTADTYEELREHALRTDQRRQQNRQRKDERAVASLIAKETFSDFD